MSSILSVSQINTYISFKLKNDPKLRGVAVKGEISDLSRNQRSNHIYFTLRDQGGSIHAVMFASNAQKLRFTPFEGMSVIAYGSIEVYERDGIYQLIATQLIPDGAGNEYLSLLKLKEKLRALGVFDAPKRAIPRYPERIAVVTSADGAAVKDVISVAKRRYPAVKTELFPTPVQGANAHLEIVQALRSADKSGADVIILTRGGGSSEDLSAFNTEAVVLAVYDCKTPVISAVGHEIDWMLCDLAADLRAPTPSGAAELATPDINDMKNEILSLKALISHYASAKIRRCENDLTRYQYLLSAFSIRQKKAGMSAQLAALKDTLEQRVHNRLKVSRITLSGLCSVLESLDPKNVVSRGYALIMKNGNIISDASGLSCGDEVSIVMRGGNVDAQIQRITGDKNEV